MNRYKKAPLALLILFATMPFFAQAETTPAPNLCFDSKNISFISIAPSVKAQCLEFKVFDEVLEQMQNFKLNDAPVYLGSLVVSPFQTDNWGSEDWNLGTVFVTYAEDNLKWLDSTKLIFPHEIGHLILDNYLADKLSVLKEFKNIKNRNWQYLRYLMPIIALRQKDPSCSDPRSQCSQKALELIAASPIDLNGPSPSVLRDQYYQKNKTQLDAFDKIVLPYHELFADLTQALFFDDPGVNEKAFLGFGMPQSPCRTFNEVLSKNFESSEPHCQLSSIRVEIWNKLVVPMLPDKKAILLKLADAIWQEVEPRLQNPEVLTSNASQDLLKRLAANLQ